MIGNNPDLNSPVQGLLAPEDSISYRIGEIERHLHNTERWFGAANTPVGETHVADLMEITNAPFTLTAGDNDFGPWVQVLGSGDTPVVTGAVKFDQHRFLVTDTNSTNPFVIQVVSGEFEDIPTKLANFDYSSSPYISATNNNDSGISDVLVRRQDVGVKVWSRVRCIGESGTVISLFFGIHEYEG